MCVPHPGSVLQALAYRKRIMDALPQRTDFTPLMTCYLTDNTSPSDVEAAKAAGVVAYKLYPAGATTNSDSGVTNVLKCVPTLEAMADLGMPLLVHGEVTDNDVDMFDREAVFIQRHLVSTVLDHCKELLVGECMACHGFLPYEERACRLPQP